MPNVIISPNMNLPVPVVGTDPGPDWATNTNSCWSVTDMHDHSPGKGVQITPAGMNISSDLSFQNNNATVVRSLRFNPQSAPLSGAADLGCLYESGVDLYYNDGSGNQIRITSGGSVAGASGTITGLPSGTASASYSAGTFIFQSATNTAANIDAGSYIFRNNTAGSNGVTVSPINALPSNYNLFLPTLPSSQKIMTLDPSGNITAPYSVDNATIVINSNVIEVGTIQSANIAPGAVGTTQIANGGVGPAQLSSTIFGLGLNATSSGILTGSGNFTVPAGVNRILILGWGGGGGGGNGSGIGGAGGNGAAVQLTYMDVTPSQVIAYSCGLGGVGGSPAGAVGGLTTFGAFSFGGGNGGGSGSSGGQPGSQIGGNGNVQAEAGANGNNASASLYAAGGITAGTSSAGGGGSGSYGVGGNGLASGNPGSNGTNGGGGGGGGAGAGGGQGGAGGLIIEW